METQEIRGLIESALEGSEATVTGDGRHFEAVVICDAFEGKRTLERHRMVYAALGSRFDDDVVHAMSIKTYTREQWAALRA